MRAILALAAMLALSPSLRGGEAPRAGVDGSNRPAYPPARGFLDDPVPSLTLVGTGERLREGVPFYSVAYYANLAELKALAGPGPYEVESLAKLLVESKVPQAVITRFQQPVGRERRKEFLLVNLRRWWPHPPFDPKAASVKRFLVFFDEPLARGEETQLWFRGGVAYARKVSGPVQRTPDRSICQAFLASYLGGQIMAGAEAPLQQDLLAELPELLRRASPLTK